MVGETVDSILVKEGRIEINFLFHCICLISQCCSYQHIMIPFTLNIYEPRYDKTNKMAVRRAKTQISLGIRPV